MPSSVAVGNMRGGSMRSRGILFGTAFTRVVGLLVGHTSEL